MIQCGDGLYSNDDLVAGGDICTEYNHGNKTRTKILCVEEMSKTIFHLQNLLS